MHKITMNYENFNGEQVSEDLYFHLSKAELLEMNFKAKGGLYNYLQSIINAHDVATLADLFKELLLKSYGEKTPDGNGFIKTPEIALKFKSSIPFSELYTELCTDADKASAFITAIIPKDVMEMYKKAEKEGNIPNDLVDKINIQKKNN